MIDGQTLEMLEYYLKHHGGMEKHYDWFSIREELAPELLAANERLKEAMEELNEEFRKAYRRL